ncbi:MAG: MCE family protein [Syntrophus sp. SKADARSKE-3]|nr:MCE family protein [Syntrophus sp. SKADARSKE-3]
MARKTSKFALGLFVTIGVLIGVSFVIWIGASKYFEKGAVYVAYFDESVQGLQVDSMVKYRGVDVGRVMKIRVAPDNRLVEVVMKLQIKDVIKDDSVAQLKSAGITGIVFIELDRRQEHEIVLGPKLTFETEYPVIASRPSDIKQIMTGFVDVYERLRLVDFEGISDRTKKAATSVETFFGSKKLTGAVQNLELAGASLDLTLQKVDKIIASGQINQVLAEAQQSLMEAKHFITALKEEIREMKLAQQSEKVGRLTDKLDRRSQRVAGNMDALFRDVRRNSDRLEKLLERLQYNPSDLIFSHPSPRDDRREETK